MDDLTNTSTVAANAGQLPTGVGLLHKAVVYQCIVVNSCGPGKTECLGQSLALAAITASCVITAGIQSALQHRSADLPGGSPAGQ